MNEEKDIVDSLYLYVNDYSLFTRNDRVVWYFKNLLDANYSDNVCAITPM